MDCLLGPRPVEERLLLTFSPCNQNSYELGLVAEMKMAVKKRASENDNIEHQRLEVLKLAGRLGNAAEACRRSGVDRTSFYQWKRRYEREGLAGLRNRPPIHRSHPHTTPADVSRRVVKLALANPAQGCDRIAVALARAGIELSGVTIQKILHKAGLGVYETRAAALEARYADGQSLNAQQIRFLESMNPCFREREATVVRPGELLAHGIFFLGRFEGLGAIYAHALVDCYSSYTFCTLAPDNRIVTSISLVREKTQPFFRAKQISPGRILTWRLSEMSASAFRESAHAEGFEYAGTTEIANGFLERFRRATLSKFLRRPFARLFPHAGRVRLQQEFDEWLAAYNESCQLLGFPNYGATPASIIQRATKAPSKDVQRGTKRTK